MGVGTWWACSCLCCVLPARGRDGRYPEFTFSSRLTGRAKTVVGEQACSGGNQPEQQPSVGRPGCAWLYRVLTGF